MAITNLRFRPEISPRERIFVAGKHLFALLGFDNTTLDAIYREAETNQAEFNQYFASKEELLQAIFEDAWSSLLAPMRSLRQPVAPKTKLKNLARSMIALFCRDQELRDLLLIEARRVHRGEMMMFTPSYTDLTATIDSLLHSALKEDSRNLEVHLLRSCLAGGFEGLLRDLALHERFGYPVNYSRDDAEQFAAEMVERLLPAG